LAALEEVAGGLAAQVGQDCSQVWVRVRDDPQGGRSNVDIKVKQSIAKEQNKENRVFLKQKKRPKSIQQPSNIQAMTNQRINQASTE
jgi:hypothetical protein